MTLALNTDGDLQLTPAQERALITASLEIVTDRLEEMILKVPHGALRMALMKARHGADVATMAMYEADE